MIKLNHDISLDLYYNEEKTIDTKEYDKNSRYITVHLTYKGEKYAISGDNIKATIKWLKPDKKAVFNDCIINSDNTITINLTEQMLLVSGVAKATLTLYDIANDQVLSTTSFNAIIEANAVQNDTIESSDEYDTLNKMILDTGKHIEALKELDKMVTEHETIRENNESNRITNEETRQNNENERIEAESIRITNENKRIEAEKNRINAENAREDNELTRQSNEEQRKSNEIVRETNEENRITAFADMKQTVDDKLESEVATDFSEADTPVFQQSIDDVLNNVNELKGDLVNLLDLTGYDFLNGYYMLSGEYNADIPESLFQCTDFILCPEGCTGKVINSVTDNIYIAGINYYDANKKFIGYELYNVGADAEYTFKAPKNALYMTINSKKAKKLTLIFIDNPLGLSVSMSANYKYNSFKGKQFAIYSDSYGDTTLPYHSWVDKISELTGKTVHNHSTAGATLTNIKDSFDDYADADYYIIAGGVNDWVNNSPLINTYNAVLEMYNKIIGVNPNAKVFFTTPIRNLDYTKADLNRTIYFPVEFYRQAIWSSVRNYTHLRCISGLKFECDVNTDGLHPTPLTSVNIAYGILDGILENGNIRDFENVKHDVPSEGYFLIEGGKISFTYTNGIHYGANGFPGAFLRLLDKVNTNHIEGDCFGYYTDEIDGVFKPCKYTVTSQGIDFRCGDNVTVANTNTPVRLELTYKGIII